MSKMVDSVDHTYGTLVPRPVVTLGYAQTLGGRLATSTGASLPKILGPGIEAVGVLGIRELARILIVTNMSLTPYGENLVLDGRVEYPDAPPINVETQEDLGCVTVS
jgi:hypothetical protein